jgi:glycosyltransferase involved in cell wall biosynthesis
VSSPDVSVVICTYDRPAGLIETLRSVQGQTNALGLTIEIVVIDNHPSQNGRAAAQAATGPFPTRVVTELTRNMSTLRNRGFAKATAPLAALIDDDEVAAPDWLDQLVGALRATGAAIAVGPRRAPRPPMTLRRGSSSAIWDCPTAPTSLSPGLRESRGTAWAPETPCSISPPASAMANRPCARLSATPGARISSCSCGFTAGAGGWSGRPAPS